MKRAVATVVAGTCLALVGVVVGSAPSWAAAASTSYVITAAKSIDGYRPGSAYVAATKSFGGPVSSTQGPRTCVATFTNGVTIAWHRRLPYSRWEKACLAFEWAKVTGTQWKTDRALHVGSTEAQLRNAYKSATKKNSNGYTVWTLAKSSNNALQAWVKNGRVAYFQLVSS
jgi:hypothetical protein